MKKRVRAFIAVCFFSGFINAGDFAVLEKQVACEKVRIAFLKQQNSRLQRDIIFCEEKIERLDESSFQLHEDSKKMRWNRHNISGKRKKLSEITERSLLSEKILSSRLKREKVEWKSATALFNALQEQRTSVQMVMNVHLGNVIRLEQSLLALMRLELERSKAKGQ